MKYSDEVHWFGDKVAIFRSPHQPMSVRENEMCEHTGTIREVADGALGSGELKLNWHQANKLRGLPKDKVPLAFARMVRRLQRIHGKWQPGPGGIQIRSCRKGRPRGLSHREWKIQQLAAGIIFAQNATKICVV